MLSAGAAVVGLVLAAHAAQASLLVYEPFNYTAAAPLDGQGNGSDVGFAVGSTWQNGGGSVGTNTVLSPGLTYTDSAGHSLEVSGNAAYIANSTTANETDYRNLNTTYGSSGQSLWISLLAKGSSNDQYLGLSLINNAIGSGRQEVLFLGQSGTDWQFVDYPTPTANGVAGDSGASGDQQAFLVYQIAIGAATGYTINMWVNPLLGSSLTAAPAATYTNSTDTFSGFDQFVLHSGEPGLLDEIRVGTSYGSVAPIASPVPEPATIKLVLVGAVGLALAARRKWSRG
jgi:hypothetical protein